MQAIGSVFLISKYWGLILFISLFLSPICFVISGILENVKFGKWKRKCWKTYLVELERSEIPPTEKVKYKKRPFDIPEKYRSCFTNIPPKPEEPWILLVLPLLLYVLILPFLSIFSLHGITYSTTINSLFLEKES